MFGNAPRALWERWFTPDEQHRIELACRCLLATGLSGKTVLFETGIGAFLEPALADRFGLTESEHRLLHSLNELGCSHDDVDLVVLSHLHFDHVGGLFSLYEEGQPMQLLFPNARYLISEAAWDTALHPHLRDKPSILPEQIQLLKDSGRVELVSGPEHPLTGEAVRFEFSDGHTRGLMMGELGGDGGVSFAADLIPGVQWVHLPLTMGYDRFPELVIDEKKAYLEDKITRGVRLFYTHDPETAMSNVSRSEDDRYIADNKKPVVAELEL